jgi:glutaminyl-peptide cyclotransferase
MICSSNRWSPAALALLVLTVSVVSMSTSAAQQKTVPVSGYQIVRSYPHDPQAFTQGLVYHEGFLYEGTGQNGKSSIRKVRLENGEVVQIERLESRYFGEGIAIVGQQLIQLTWQSGVGFVYDLATFARERTFSYTGEGWGLVYDGARLIMSDGTEWLRFLDAGTLKETGRVAVKDGGRSVTQINELEMVKGELYANVWGTDRIARISPKTGQLLGWIDLKGLLSPRESSGVDVLNGIAYDAKGDRLFVTGKLWPRVFEIKVK